MNRFQNTPNRPMAMHRNNQPYRYSAANGMQAAARAAQADNALPVLFGFAAYLMGIPFVVAVLCVMAIL
ncbi:MAG: hypothetical protein AAF747_06255 [Planctomycetota bacterium]